MLMRQSPAAPCRAFFFSRPGFAVWLGIIVLINASEIAFPRSNARGGGGIAEREEARGGGGGGGSGGDDDDGDIDFACLARETIGPFGANSVDVFIVINNFGDVW